MKLENDKKVGDLKERLSMLETNAKQKEEVVNSFLFSWLLVQKLQAYSWKGESYSYPKDWVFGSSTQWSQKPT